MKRTNSVERRAGFHNSQTYDEHLLSASSASLHLNEELRFDLSAGLVLPLRFTLPDEALRGEIMMSSHTKR